MKASGIVEIVSRNGKALKLENDPNIWYSVRVASKLNKAQKGDSVHFDYKENEVGDAVFYNIQDPGVQFDGEEEEERPARGRSAAPARGKAVGGGGSVASDPRQQSIVRQNALTQANTLVRTVVGDGGLDGFGQGEMLAMADDVIAIARIFEAYSMGEV